MNTIWEHVSKLPAEQRTVIELRFLENKNLEEIAVSLDSPIESIRSWLHQALESLRT